MIHHSASTPDLSDSFRSGKSDEVVAERAVSNADLPNHIGVEPPSLGSKAMQGLAKLGKYIKENPIKVLLGTVLLAAGIAFTGGGLLLAVVGAATGKLLLFAGASLIAYTFGREYAKEKLQGAQKQEDEAFRKALTNLEKSAEHMRGALQIDEMEDEIASLAAGVEVEDLDNDGEAIMVQIQQAFADATLPYSAMAIFAKIRTIVPEPLRDDSKFNAKILQLILSKDFTPSAAVNMLCDLTVAYREERLNGMDPKVAERRINAILNHDVTYNPKVARNNHVNYLNSRQF
jgi:hypothetical protein